MEQEEKKTLIDLDREHRDLIFNMTEDEFNYAAGDLKAIVDPDVVIIAEVKGKPVGFGMTLPDINQLLIKNKKGRRLAGRGPSGSAPNYPGRRRL